MNRNSPLPKHWRSIVLSCTAALTLGACGSAVPEAEDTLGSIAQEEVQCITLGPSVSLSSVSINGNSYTFRGTWSVDDGSRGPCGAQLTFELGGQTVSSMNVSNCVSVSDENYGSGAWEFTTHFTGCGDNQTLQARSVLSPYSSCSPGGGSSNHMFFFSAAPCPPPPPPSCLPCDPIDSCVVPNSIVSCGYHRPSASAYTSCEGWCILRDACGLDNPICPFP